MQNQLTPEQQQAVTQRVAAINRKAKRGVWIGLIIFLICAGAFWYIIYNAFTSGGPQANPSSAPIVVTASQLEQAYNDNSVAADQKYKGNLIEVSGVIVDIGTGLFNEPYVMLAGDTMGDNVQCIFDASEDNAIASLVKGQSVTLEGTGDGSSLSNAALSHCSIVQNASSTN